jgi:hypothetical protein
MIKVFEVVSIAICWFANAKKCKFKLPLKFVDWTFATIYVILSKLDCEVLSYYYGSQTRVLVPQ